MLNDTVKSVLASEGPATFVTTGSEGPHLAATWQSYIEVIDEETLLFPAGGYRQTEANVNAGSALQLILGGHVNGKGLGFRLTGTAEFQSGTPLYERVHGRFPWSRAAVVLHVTRVEKVLG